MAKKKKEEKKKSEPKKESKSKPRKKESKKKPTTLFQKAPSRMSKKELQDECRELRGIVRSQVKVLEVEKIVEVPVEKKSAPAPRGAPTPFELNIVMTDNAHVTLRNANDVAGFLLNNNFVKQAVNKSP